MTVFPSAVPREWEGGGRVTVLDQRYARWGERQCYQLVTSTIDTADRGTVIVSIHLS